jgi:hypothetical protein
MVSDEEITCKKIDEFWRVSWEPINKQVPLRWDLFLDTKAMQSADGIVDLGVKEKHFRQMKPFIRKARRNGYDFASVSSKGWSKNVVQVLDSDKSFLVSQQYKYDEGNWSLVKTVKSWKPEGDSLDLTKLH